MSTEGIDARRHLPAMNQLLEEPEISELISLYGRDLVRVQIANQLEVLRAELLAASSSAENLEGAIAKLLQRVASALQSSLGRGLQRVLNASGVFVHTNLGRAPLPKEVAASLPPLLDAYCNVELDLESGHRDDRNRSCEALLRALTGAPAALVVNNNAAALVLVLATVAQGCEVIVSRGELVEIGGSFRVPTILEAAGARLVEVGTTNRTRLADYENAIGSKTALVLKVFPSNYRMTGFVEAVEVPALLDLCLRRELILFVDEGSGLLRSRCGVPQLESHASLRELMTLGCHLACGSGDKLLGGPQAGLLMGRQDLVQRCHRHPLYRALRPDRACLAVLEAVLRRHLAGGEFPLDRMWADEEVLRQRLTRLAGSVGGEIITSEAFLGGGAAPELAIPGLALALPENDALVRRLREGVPPVVVSQRRGQLILDLRTIDPDDDEILEEALRRAGAPKPD